MAKLDAKCKICRREGEKLLLKGSRCLSPKCSMVKRNYPPGLHGESDSGRFSEYNIRLREKQKAKRIYGISERQFRRYYKEAVKKKSNTGDTLLRLLELRLDNVVYRLGFALSRAQARQLISHANFLVNNKPVNVPSYELKQGDIIKVRDKSLKNDYFKDISSKLDKRSVPKWLELDTKKLEGKVVSLPLIEDMDLSINMQSIVEFYSR